MLACGSLRAIAALTSPVRGLVVIDASEAAEGREFALWAVSSDGKLTDSVILPRVEEHGDKEFMLKRAFRHADVDGRPEVRRVLVKERKLFTAEYTASIRQWRETGEAVFPPGTCGMRGMPGVTIRAGPRPFQRA